MYDVSHHDLDRRLTGALDRAGIVGSRFRESLTKDLKTKMVLRDGRDLLEVVGAQGSGRHTVASAVHQAAKACLDRQGPLVDFDCARADLDDFADELRGVLTGAGDGTLVLDRIDALDNAGLATLRQVLESTDGGAVVCALRGGVDAPAIGPKGAGQIHLKPLHEREEDIWELIEHFFGSAKRAASLDGCRGFSRQAMADISTALKDTGVQSVRRLRAVVRDLVFEVADGPNTPLKITSEHVRPYLEAQLGQTAEEREERQAELVASQFDSLMVSSALERIAELHGLPPELVSRQADVLRDVIGYIDDVPRSYRNIMDRSEDVMRSALWVLTGATTQAEFRRYFGEERFMRPTKSVAWAFYNRVFKRDM